MDPVLVVEPPKYDPRLGGIRAVAEVESGNDRILQGGQVAYSAPECGTALGDAALCFPSDGPAQQEKTYEGFEIFQGVGPAQAFYAGSECYLGEEEYAAVVESALDSRIDLKIEKALDDWAAAATGASATDFVEAIAAVENDADLNYHGRPVIFLNRGDATRARAAKAIFGKGDGSLVTVNGTPVVASASITAGRVFATGAVKIIESNTITTQTVNPTTNREQAIAERGFVVLVDCLYISAATVA